MSNNIRSAWVYISYDFGLKGDYKTLFAFLDNHEAIDCGRSSGAFEFEYSSEDLTVEQKFEEVKSALEEEVDINKGDRIYILVYSNDGLSQGKFIFGSRQKGEWEGYGDADDDDDDGLPF